MGIKLTNTKRLRRTCKRGLINEKFQLTFLDDPDRFVHKSESWCITAVQTISKETIKFDSLRKAAAFFEVDKITLSKRLSKGRIDNWELIRV
jgi:hypothetical protein